MAFKKLNLYNIEVVNTHIYPKIFKNLGFNTQVACDIAEIANEEEKTIS